MAKIIITRFDGLASLSPARKNDKTGEYDAMWMWKGTEADYSEIEWYDTENSCPTEAEIDAEVVRLQALSDAEEYSRNRKAEYPELAEQLDLLYHDMTSGIGYKTGEWYKAVNKVKTDNPKG